MLSLRKSLRPVTLLARDIFFGKNENMKMMSIRRTPFRRLLTASSNPYSRIGQPDVRRPTDVSFLQLTRSKSKSAKKNKKEKEEESDSEEVEEEDVVDKHTKIMNLKVGSTRLDLILKGGLGTARNKIETLFYESKIRLNGRKVYKKSHQVEVGDEIDVIKGLSVSNPDFLQIARVEVLDIAKKGEELAVKIRRCKSLTVENYEEGWKPE